ncbi:MAG: hypothetical protein Q8920_08960 [Bacillota bacterium]|nr:hypothetical protein [Bacillota bacterium]
MNHLLIRRIIGIVVIFCGMMAGMLIFAGSLNSGLAFGIFGICLALGAMVLKIGAGKDSITLNLREDGIEPAITSEKSGPDNIDKNPVSEDKSRTEQEDINQESQQPVNSRQFPKKLKLIIIIAGILLLFDIIFFIIVFTK